MYLPARVLPIILVSSRIDTFVYLYVFVYVCVYVCTDTEFWILRAALNFGPLRDHFSDNLHSSFILSIWKGDPSGICTSCQRMILIKNVQASKTTKKRNNRRKKKKTNPKFLLANHTMEHLENLEIPFLSHWQSLPPFIFGIPTACLEATKPSITQHNNCSSLSSHTS